MKILLDECIPRKFHKDSFAGHDCSTVPDAGLAGRKNGELLSLAERNGFRVFLSLDKGCSVTNKILRNGVSQSLSSGHGQTASPISWLMPKLVSIK
jgi:predicted nuclease of predicted toxin-antitoxin system